MRTWAWQGYPFNPDYILLLIVRAEVAYVVLADGTARSVYVGDASKDRIGESDVLGVRVRSIMTMGVLNSSPWVEL